MGEFLTGDEWYWRLARTIAQRVIGVLVANLDLIVGWCGAGCDFSASYYRAANQWSIDPSIGAQIFFGSRGNEYHTGVVVGFDSGHVYTVEGNTGYSAGYSGGAVLERTYGRNDPRITGYGVPRWSMAGGHVPVVDVTNVWEDTGELEVDGWLGWQLPHRDRRLAWNVSNSGIVRIRYMFDAYDWST